MGVPGVLGEAHSEPCRDEEAEDEDEEDGETPDMISIDDDRRCKTEGERGKRLGWRAQSKCVLN
jgi:hypothetical protein